LFGLIARGVHTRRMRYAPRARRHALHIRTGVRLAVRFVFAKINMLNAEIFLPTEYNLLCVCISNVALHSNVLFLVSRKSCMKLDGAFRPFGQLEIVTRII